MSANRRPPTTLNEGHQPRIRVQGGYVVSSSGKPPPPPPKGGSSFRPGTPLPNTSAKK